MELKILSAQNAEVGKKKLPKQFEEPVRKDLIKRAVEAVQSHNRQAYGADTRAGMKWSATLSKKRREYRASYGHGISRVPRKITSRRGTQFNWTAANVPGVVGGRRAHPPKSEKVFAKKINDRERKKAIRSALSATMSKELVAGRGHVLPEKFPFIISNDFEKFDKTKTILDALKKIGLDKDLARAEKKKVRAGKGKSRARKYKKSKTALLVVSGKCSLLKAASNIPGIDVVEVKNMNAELLAPGSEPGRLTVFTDSAIDKLGKENLFV
ncbi:50S ribosomal protein L4 [Candidatus Woesearchaeota archaeon]|nr:50S ribosomal protein L4 [Candidatus Woesearchaeota archaeon]